MSKEQVSALNDTELNRAMIWCYPVSGYCFMYAGHVYNGVSIELDRKLDYLSDYNLTMPLAVENNLGIEFMAVTRCEDYSSYKVSVNKNPLRAICEVLVMIKLEEQ
tara:strand:- start:2124 stop:2441 length:318 start_codon:yes stop_codon:yes gene_type:complete